MFAWNGKQKKNVNELSSLLLVAARWRPTADQVLNPTPESTASHCWWPLAQIRGQSLNYILFNRRVKQRQLFLYMVFFSTNFWVFVVKPLAGRPLSTSTLDIDTIVTFFLFVTDRRPICAGHRSLPNHLFMTTIVILFYFYSLPRANEPDWIVSLQTNSCLFFLSRYWRLANAK